MNDSVKKHGSGHKDMDFEDMVEHWWNNIYASEKEQIARRFTKKQLPAVKAMCYSACMTAVHWAALQGGITLANTVHSFDEMVAEQKAQGGSEEQQSHSA